MELKFPIPFHFGSKQHTELGAARPLSPVIAKGTQEAFNACFPLQPPLSSVSMSDNCWQQDLVTLMCLRESKAKGSAPSQPCAPLSPSVSAKDSCCIGCPDPPCRPECPYHGNQSLKMGERKERRDKRHGPCPLRHDGPSSEVAKCFAERRYALLPES